MPNIFHKLLSALEADHLTIQPANLHGFLTASATLADADMELVYKQVAGNGELSPILKMFVNDVMYSIYEDFSFYTYHAQFETDDHHDAERWINGYLTAVP